MLFRALLFELLLAVSFLAIDCLPREAARISKISQRAIDNSLEVEWTNSNGVPVLSGNLGISLPLSVGSAEEIGCTGDFNQCFDYGDFAHIDTVEKPGENCTRIEWKSRFARRFEDCFRIEPNTHWYGGNAAYHQHWPVEDQGHSENPSVAIEFQFPNENYWLISNGVTIHVDEDVPLFTSVNTETGLFCLVAKDEHPYTQRTELSLKYDVCVGENIKEVHQKSAAKYYEKPTGLPDETMLIRPFWSTWAQYKTSVNQSIVIDMAKRVKSEGFELSSHMEIDDHWESCYGEATFNPEKFPDPAAMVQELREMNLRVTLWIHPFINIRCPSFTTPLENSYFVQDPKGKTGIVSWWQGSNAGLIDFTNPMAVDWWKGRLELLRTEFGVDSFKFDAGETNYLPYAIKLNGDSISDLQPNLFSTKYVEAVSSFGGMIEVRTGRRNQNLPIFSRMFDKDSRWGYDNGLQSMIPTLLHFGLHGYPFVLPDMIGGNAYGEKPSAELYVRWMQVNAFMPAVQFSIVPWDFSSEVVQITKDVLAIREEYKDLIYKAANQALVDGSPINRPMWWVDPEDSETYTIDSQYMLGDDILVAPVVEEGALERDIYLPRGTWETKEGTVYEGPQWLRSYAAPLNTLPFFLKK